MSSYGIQLSHSIRPLLCKGLHMHSLYCYYLFLCHKSLIIVYNLSINNYKIIAISHLSTNLSTTEKNLSNVVRKPNSAKHSVQRVLSPVVLSFQRKLSNSQVTLEHPIYNDSVFNPPSPSQENQFQIRHRRFKPRFRTKFKKITSNAAIQWLGKAYEYVVKAHL